MKATLEYDLEVNKDKKAFDAAQDASKNQNKADRKDSMTAEIRQLMLTMHEKLQDPALPEHDRHLLLPVWKRLGEITGKD
jgi:hypothetical protein